MESFAQSSLIDVELNQAVELIQSPAEMLSMDDEKPTLTYYFENGLNDEGVVKFNLVYGLSKITWDSPVTSSKDGRVFATQAQEGPFSYFKSKHEIINFQGKTLIRDDFSFATESSLLIDLVKNASINHGIYEKQEELATNETQKIELVQKGSA